MDKITSAPVYHASRTSSFTALLIAVIGYVLLSPKWLVPVFAWIAPLCLLYFYRFAPFRFKLPWLFLTLYITTLIATYEVIPFPLPVMAVVGIIGTALNTLPFLLDKWVSKYTRHFLSTLVFPTTFVVKEFYDSSGGGGVWGSIANTQFSLKWLVQLASVSGLWGISFLVWWFAAVIVWTVNQHYHGSNYKNGITFYSAVLLFILAFGSARYYSNRNGSNELTRVAGVTVPLFPFMEALYKDVFKTAIKIEPTISQSSPELQQLNLAMIPFIENPDTARFRGGYKALQVLYDSLFSLSTKAAEKGAKIITWSEANALVLKNEAQQLLARGSAFSKNHKVYLLMAMGTIEPGKINPGRNFIENKTVLTGPDGNVLNVFHKNHPVPYAEHSTPGDGKIPVIETPYGKISISICYDADFPGSMQQLSTHKSGILLLPSSDWFAISPYHSYMAVFRGIENGCSIMRQAANGLSVATDYRGKVFAQKSFFDPGEKLLMATIPIAHVNTIYSIIGNSFAYACVAFFAGTLIFLIVKSIMQKKAEKMR